jgi:hypothetical protein
MRLSATNRGGLNVAVKSKALIPFSAAVLALAALASCGEDAGTSAGSDATGESGTAQASLLFPDSFKGVCSGASVSSATAYDPAAKAHKALYFTTYEDDLTDRSSSLPSDWTVLFSPDSDALRDIDLVVCARRTAAQEVKVCEGYKDDDKPTQNKVRWHTATYELSVREAATGKTLAETTAEATESDCPMFWTFDGDSDTQDGYASLPDTAVADFLRPHIAP